MTHYRHEMYQSEYTVTIRCDGSHSNSIDRLEILLQQFAQAEQSPMHINVSRNPSLVIRTSRRAYRFHQEDLRYLTSDGHYCICHLISGDARLRISFADAAAQLQAAAPGVYWAVNRGVLLNHAHIVDHTRDAFVMDDGTSFPVSRKNRAGLFTAFDSSR